MSEDLQDVEQPEPLRFRDVFNPDDWPAQERETHLVEGILSTTLTVIAADPAVGKTHFSVGLAAALLNGEPEFLGQEILTELDSVAFLTTDADGAHSIQRRIKPLVDHPAWKQVHAMDYPLSRGFDWEEFTERVHDVGAELLVVDNVPGIVDDPNDFAEAKRVTRPLLRLCEEGTAVLMLTHTAKPGMYGPAQGINAPIGSRYWTIPARVKGSLTAGEGSPKKLLKASNNDGDFSRIEARLDVIEESPVWSVWENGPSKREVEAVKAADDWQALAERVLKEQPAATSLRALGDHYAPLTGKSPYTIRQRLKAHVEHSGGGWVQAA